MRTATERIVGELRSLFVRMVAGELLTSFDPETVSRAAGMLAAQPEDGWKPIETAPKDGTFFLAWSDDWDDRPGVARWRAGHWWDTEFWERPTDGYFSPTHWMPLPAAPRHPIRGGEHE